jgi:hypothetical protein
MKIALLMVLTPTDGADFVKSFETPVEIVFKNDTILYKAVTRVNQRSANVPQ